MSHGDSWGEEHPRYMGWQSRSLEIVQITTGDQCVGAECVLGKEVGAEVRDLVTEMVGQMTYIFVEHTKDFGFDDGGEHWTLVSREMT